MDIVTHACLGACIGEMLLVKSLGRKALWLGAAAQSLPDTDTLSSLLYPTDQALLIHRGLTHSFLFALLAGTGLALLLRRKYQWVTLGRLMLFFCGQLILHDLLDVCNAYGTGLWEPFDHSRYSFHLLYVADPLFSVPVVICTATLIFNRHKSIHKLKWSVTAIVICALYLLVSFRNKIYIDGMVRHSFAQHRPPEGYIITPAPFTNMLWYIIVRGDQGFYTAYASVLDKRPIVFEFHPQNGQLLNGVRNRQLLHHLISFAGPYYTIQGSGSRQCLNVLRFGQVQGWRQTQAPFALSYPITAPADRAILQKGRLSGWDLQAVKIYLKRIGGLH